jgi:hypothetical protein
MRQHETSTCCGPPVTLFAKSLRIISSLICRFTFLHGWSYSQFSVNVNLSPVVCCDGVFPESRGERQQVTASLLVKFRIWKHICLFQNNTNIQDLQYMPDFHHATSAPLSAYEVCSMFVDVFAILRLSVVWGVQMLTLWQEIDIWRVYTLAQQVHWCSSCALSRKFILKTTKNYFWIRRM